MIDDAYELASLLKEKMDNDPRIIRLNALEKQLNSNEEVITLVMKKDKANNDYNDILRYYSSDSIEANKYQKILANAKKELYEHPLVKEYNSVYKEVRELYREVNDTLFSSFNAFLCPKEE